MSGLGLHSSLEPAEPRRLTLLSLVFGAGPMLPFVLAVAMALARSDWRGPALHAALLWGAAILAFLAGVRRGLSFRTEGGARVAEMGSMLWIFVLAAAALFSPWPALAAALLILGYASVGLFDHRAALHGEAPPFFATMRPVQMAVPVLCLLLLAALAQT